MRKEREEAVGEDHEGEVKGRARQIFREAKMSQIWKRRGRVETCLDEGKRNAINSWIKLGLFLPALHPKVV